MRARAKAVAATGGVLALFGLGTLFISFGLRCLEGKAESLTWLRMVELNGKLDQFERQHGRLPTDVSYLAPEADSWGTPLKLALSPEARITSAGADLKFDTDDDLVLDRARFGRR